MHRRLFPRTIICALLISIILINRPIPEQLTAPPAIAVAQDDAPQVVARSAIVMDADTGAVLFEKDADARRPMASTTKLMTLLVALEDANLSSVVTVPGSASTVPADSTRVPVYPGEEMPFEDLFYGMMIKSGNDAANAIATLISGSVSAFVERMNEKARTLGLKNTHFVNPHGYPAQSHYASARDLATITRQGLKRAAFRRILTARSHKMGATALRKSYTLYNTYAILDPDSPYYYQYAVGGKTGYASASGQCFVCVAEKGGHTLISVVLNAGGTRPPKWQDTALLMKYGFSVLGA